MGIFSNIKAKLVGSSMSTPKESAFDIELFIYIKIPDSIGPIDRGEKYEDKLEPLLAAHGLGSISGGGCSLGDPQPNGKRFIEFCGIDVDTTDIDKVRELLRETLPTLGAPVGTQLYYTKTSRKLQDELGDNGWLLEQERTLLHPGFNI